MATEYGFDPDQLRAKYREEREKRMRSDGNDQYRTFADSLKPLLDDPYQDSPRERPPVTDTVEIAIVGAGMASVMTGAKLRQEGFQDIRIIDVAGDFGGTWYWNRYPGAQCDIESYIYMPMLEETGYMPTQKYAISSEIRGHLQRIARKYDLYRDTLFQTEMASLDWDEAESLWRIVTRQGDRFAAKFVFICNGPFTQPKLPDIPGIESYEGHIFHTSRWDYDYTGGDELGGLDKLADKRVGIIGTGATSVQCIPHLGRNAKSLHVFQRTPSAVDVRDNRPTDVDWYKSLKPGWQRARMRNFIENVHGTEAETDLVNDGWTRMIKELTGLAAQKAAKELGRKLTSGERQELLDMADFRTMENIRARVDEWVEDTDTADALRPWYARWCKRPCFHDDYLPTFNLPNVKLVDATGKGVERFTEKGIVVNGVEYELDCIILGTGFSIGNNYVDRLGFEITGIDDVRLSRKWADGFQTLHGMHIHGFPNLFVTGSTQTGITYNYTNMLAEQVDHLAYLMNRARSLDADRVHATAAAEAAWVAEIHRLARRGTAYYQQCTPGYFSNEGKLNSGNGILAGTYGLGPQAFWNLLAKWRDDGGCEGITFEKKDALVLQ